MPPTLTLTEPPDPQVAPAPGRTESGYLADLFVREESRLLRYAMSLTTGDFAAAQDLVQDAFLRLQRQDLAGIESPRAWLCTVIRRLASDRRRKRTELPLPDHHDGADTTMRNAAESLTHAETLGRLRFHLADLPPRDRDLLTLKYHEDLDYATIATRTGLSVSNVGFRLHTLVKKLAAALDADAE